MNPTLTSKEQLMVLNYLQQLTENMGNSSCNDMYWPNNWTPEDIQSVKSSLSPYMDHHDGFDPFNFDVCVLDGLITKLKASWL